MPIIIPEKVNPLQLSYPDFTLGAIINPDEFDQNNLDIMDKLNEFIDTINVTIDNTVEVETIVNGANTKSDTAIATANSAVTSANNAVTTANTASTNASNAVTTANNASTVSTNAINKSTQVETDFNTLEPILLQAVEDAESAVEAVASKADVAYVNSVAESFQLGVVLPDSIDENQLKPAVRDKLNDTNALTLGDELPSYYTDIIARLGYTPLNETNYTANNILEKLKTVDGTGSGLDADTVQGYTPVNKTGDTMTGALKFQNEYPVRATKGKMMFADVGTFTGTLAIKFTTTSLNDVMLHLKIIGFVFDSTDKSVWETNIGGRKVTHAYWDTVSAITKGIAPYKRVRFATDGTRAMILLGDMSTVWVHPSIEIENALASWTGQDIDLSQLEFSILSNETGITTAVETNVQQMISGKRGTLTIPTNSWGTYTDVAGFSYYSNITLSGLRADDFMEICFRMSETLSENSLYHATNAGVNARLGDNVIGFLAKSIPAYPLTFDYLIQSGV